MDQQKKNLVMGIVIGAAVLIAIVAFFAMQSGPSGEMQSATESAADQEARIQNEAASPTP